MPPLPPCFFLWQAELRRLMGSDENVLVLDVYCALGPKELKLEILQRFNGKKCSPSCNYLESFEGKIWTFFFDQKIPFCLLDISEERVDRHELGFIIREELLGCTKLTRWIENQSQKGDIDAMKDRPVQDITKRALE